MTSGLTNKSSPPAGRKGFADGKPTRTAVIRPHKYADGQDAAGTNASNVHGKHSPGYLDASSLQYRAELRGHTSRKGHKNG